MQLRDAIQGRIDAQSTMKKKKEEDEEVEEIDPAHLEIDRGPHTEDDGTEYRLYNPEHMDSIPGNGKTELGNMGTTEV